METVLRRRDTLLYMTRIVLLAFNLYVRFAPVAFAVGAV